MEGVKRCRKKDRNVRRGEREGEKRGRDGEEYANDKVC